MTSMTISMMTSTMMVTIAAMTAVMMEKMINHPDDVCNRN
jgi:hypothetical protein